MSTAVPSSSQEPRSPLSRLWDRQLDHYPDNGTRFTSLGIIVLVTIILYYQLYLAGGVATNILRDLDMSFVYYVNVSVLGYALGALASVIAGLADRYGRANIVTFGLLVVGLLCAVALPNVTSKLGFAVVYIAIGFVEGIILVATLRSCATSPRSWDGRRRWASGRSARCSAASWSASSSRTPRTPPPGKTST